MTITNEPSTNRWPLQPLCRCFRRREPQLPASPVLATIGFHRQESGPYQPGANRAQWHTADQLHPRGTTTDSREYRRHRSAAGYANAYALEISALGQAKPSAMLLSVHATNTSRQRSRHASIDPQMTSARKYASSNRQRTRRRPMPHETRPTQTTANYRQHLAQRGEMSWPAFRGASVPRVHAGVEPANSMLFERSPPLNRHAH
jgi:hypothetical protein